MNQPKSQINQGTLNILFIGAEAIVAIVLIVLIFRSLEATSNLFTDILLGAGGLFLAASVPIWTIGAYHLYTIGKMANYLKALLLSLGISLLLALITAFIPFPFIYWLSLASVIIVFNYFALK